MTKTIALKAHTTVNTTPLTSGFCYLLLPNTPITVAELVAEKVRAELRKARAGGIKASSVELLIDGFVLDFGPVAEMAAIRAVTARVECGEVLVLVDGVERGLVETVTLTKTSVVRFDVMVGVAA